MMARIVNLIKILFYLLVICNSIILFYFISNFNLIPVVPKNPEPQQIEGVGCNPITQDRIQDELKTASPLESIGFETYNNQTLKAVAIHKPTILIPMDDYNTGKLDKICHEWLHIKLEDKNTKRHFCEDVMRK